MSVNCANKIRFTVALQVANLHAPQIDNYLLNDVRTEMSSRIASSLFPMIADHMTFSIYGRFI